MEWAWLFLFAILSIIGIIVWIDFNSGVFRGAGLNEMNKIRGAAVRYKNRKAIAAFQRAIAESAGTQNERLGEDGEQIEEAASHERLIEAKNILKGLLKMHGSTGAVVRDLCINHRKFVPILLNSYSTPALAKEVHQLESELAWLVKRMQEGGGPSITIEDGLRRRFDSLL